MTPTLTAVLCLGLSLELRSPLLTGILPKPVIRTKPGSVVASGTEVTISCEGTTGAQMYSLYKEGEQDFWKNQTPLHPGKKAQFLIPSIEQNHAGRYYCNYHTPAGMSEHSEPLELVVTGIYHTKPNLTVLPSPVVTTGEKISLQCFSEQRYDGFTLTKGNQNFSSYLASWDVHTGWAQAFFLEGPVTTNHSGTFRCYGYCKEHTQVWSEPSDPVEIHVSVQDGRNTYMEGSRSSNTSPFTPGQSKKPSLLPQPGQILGPGVNLTLQCRSDISYDRFALFKEKETGLSHSPGLQLQAGLSQASFPLGPVRVTTGGRYRCCGAHNLSSEWSAPSEPVDILISGQFPVTPSLSVLPNHTVSSGENVTLLCEAESQVDTLLLTKEGAAHPPLLLRSILQAGKFQAEFSMSAVTSALAGTYRCYGSHSSSPYLLSHPSAPVELVLSGLEIDQKILIGISIAFLLGIFFVITLFLWRHSQNKHRKDAQREIMELQIPSEAEEPVPRRRGPQKSSRPAAAIQGEILYASVKMPQPEDSLKLDNLNPRDENPREELYAQVKPSRIRTASATTPSNLSRELLNSKEDREMDSKAAVYQGPQDVNYAHLCFTTQRKSQLSPLPPSQRR